MGDIDDIIEKIKDGDLSRLNQEEQVRYYTHECGRMGLDPAARPIAFLRFQGALTLYLKRTGTDMLAAKHRVSTVFVDGPRVMRVEGTETSVLYARARATMPDGRTAEDVGTLPAIDVVNGLMKVASKALRRVTARITGWGGLEESELDTMHGAQVIDAPAISSHIEVGPARELWEAEFSERMEGVATVGQSLDDVVRCVCDVLDEFPASGNRGLELAKDFVQRVFGKGRSAVQKELLRRHSAKHPAIEYAGSPIEAPKQSVPGDVTGAPSGVATRTISVTVHAEAPEAAAAPKTVEREPETVAANPPDPPGQAVPGPLAAFVLAVDEIEFPGESVELWIQRRPALATLSREDREAAWKALCARTETVGGMKNAKAWLKKSIATEDARRDVPEHDESAARASTDSTKRAAATTEPVEPEDPERSAIESEGEEKPAEMTFAAWKSQHFAKCTTAIHAARAFLKYEGALNFIDRDMARKTCENAIAGMPGYDYESALEVIRQERRNRDVAGRQEAAK